MLTQAAGTVSRTRRTSAMQPLISSWQTKPTGPLQVSSGQQFGSGSKISAHQRPINRLQTDNIQNHENNRVTLSPLTSTEALGWTDFFRRGAGAVSVLVEGLVVVNCNVGWDLTYSMIAAMNAAPYLLNFSSLTPSQLRYSSSDTGR